MANGEITIKVDGMHCSSCVLAVENALMDLDNVKTAKADLESGMVNIKCDSEKVSLEDIDEAVKEVGFSVDLN